MGAESVSGKTTGRYKAGYIEQDTSTGRRAWSMTQSDFIVVGGAPMLEPDLPTAACINTHTAPINTAKRMFSGLSTGGQWGQSPKNSGWS